MLTSVYPSSHFSVSLAPSGLDKQISQGNARGLLLTYPSHLRPIVWVVIGLWIPTPSRPRLGRLICASCSSGRGFASGFLSTLPRDNAVAFS